MAFISRGRSRSRPMLIRGRGKLFRGRGGVGNRGEGLRITLSNRAEGGESVDQRSSRGSIHKHDRHSRDRRENPDYVGDDNCDRHEKSAERKRSDHYEFRRGDVSPSMRRSHDKIDLASDAESLRITVGNEKFFKERVDESPRRVTPLSERLGPPVDMTEPLDGRPRQRDYGQRRRYSNDRFDCEKEKTYWLHEESERSEKYKRCDERQLNRYNKRTPVDDSPYDKARKTDSKDHDWKNSHDEYSDSCQDHQRANFHHRFEHRNMDNDSMHRRSGDRYDKEEYRYGKRKYDRYKDYDHSRKVPFSPEMKRDDSNKSYQSDRRREAVDCFEDYGHDVNVNRLKHDIERKKFHINEMSSREASHSKIESNIHSSNSEKRAASIERAKQRGLVEQIDNELSSSHQSQTPGVAMKPLKSILKKRSDSASGYDAGSQSGVAEQVSDFLKQFQAPLPSDDLVSMSSGRASLEMQVNASVQSNTNMPGSVQSEMDVDDEERFLYGDSEISAAITKAHQSQALFPVLDKEVTKSKISEEHNPANPKMMFDPSSSIPSWMKPQPSIEPGSTGENKGEDMDKTVQNILKSIGFNFDLSKRMQELAKLKKQKEEESQFSINKNASFLGGGISSADIRAKLFKKEDAVAHVESFMKEAKETVKHSDTGYQDYAVDHQKDEPLVLTHQDQSKKIRDVDLIHQTTVSASQQPTLVSHFQSPPLQYPSFYSGMYHPAYSQQTGHPSLVPPGNPHMHLPPAYSYASPYDQHSYSNPVSHLVQSYASHMSSAPEIGSLKPRRPTGSANLTIVPIDDGKKQKQTAPEVTKKAVKREREKSPEYSRIVIAPKSKSKDERSPAQKILKVKRESSKDKTKKPYIENKLSDTILHTETAQVSKPVLQEQKDEVKPSKLSTSEKQSLLKECEDRKKKLQLLEKELGKLKKHQNEIMRRRQRQRDGHKDPLLVQNSKLQEEISLQIRHLRKASEKSAFVLKQADKEEENSSAAARTDVDDPVQDDMKTEKNVGIKYEFYDPGGHWCGVCHHVSASLFDHFTHLQSKKHKQKCDPYDRPWLTDITQNNDKRQEKVATVEVKAMKGVEFMMSTDAFYCSLCHIFSGDVTTAELHIKSEEHFAKYENHLQQNEFYEKRYTLEKTAFLSQVKEEEKKNGGKEKVKKCKSLQSEIGVHHVVENLPSYKSNLDSHDEERKQEENETPISQKHKSICEDKAKPQKEEIAADSTKQEDSTKGKIAIKLTGKTGIKPQPRILPPWTPVTKKELLITKNKTEALPVKKGITKSESVHPPSLDTFLTIGGPTTKKLPVYKLRSGTVKKPCNVRAKSPDDIKKQEGEKLTDIKSDMKLLGIEEDMSKPIAAKKPPPPRSQNLSLPKDPSSNSSSSAEELYSVFYHDSACTAKDCASDINLDDIPIPPPPPQPSIITPGSKETETKDTEMSREDEVMSSAMIISSKVLMVDTENNCTNRDLVETPLGFAHGINVAEDGGEQDCENLNTVSLKDAVKIDSSIVVGDDDKVSQEQIFEVEGDAGCRNELEKYSDISDETNEKQHLNVNGNKNMKINENEGALPQKESTVSSAPLQTDPDNIDSHEETSEHRCHLGDVTPVVGQDFEEEIEMASEDPAIHLIDNSHISPVDAAGVSSKAPGSDIVPDSEDIGSNGSCESMHMDSDFEVLDEYEAD